MRKRKVDKTDPINELTKIYKRFAHAYFTKKDVDAALKIRREADKILKKHPEYQESVPVHIGRAAFIDWDRFIKFPETKHMDPEIL